MTIIAYRDGVMAADSMTTKNSMRYGVQQKIRRLPDGGLYGAAGSGQDCDAVYEWLCGRGDRPKVADDDGFRALIARPGIDLPIEMGCTLVERQMNVPYAVVGENSTEYMAFGAFAMGATAERAVEICIEHTVWVGGPVQVEKL